jgi:DNA topoisomerase-1
LPPGIEPEDINFEVGLQLIDLPRELGTHPETDNPIEAGIGRYGPFVRHKKPGEKDTYASLKKSDDVLNVDLERALELIEAKEARNRPARTLGEHPETGKTIEVWNGRYGPYIKHNRKNVSLPDDVTIDEITLEQAVDLIAKKSKGKTSKKKKKAKS